MLWGSFTLNLCQLKVLYLKTYKLFVSLLGSVFHLLETKARRKAKIFSLASPWFWSSWNSKFSWKPGVSIGNFLGYWIPDTGKVDWGGKKVRVQSSCKHFYNHSLLLLIPWSYFQSDTWYWYFLCRILNTDAKTLK
jgi:hypothetical protein